MVNRSQNLKSALKRNAYLINDTKDLEREQEETVDRKPKTIELKKKSKILKNEFLRGMEKEAYEMPEEVTHKNDRKMPFKDHLDDFEEKHFTRRRITNKEKKSFNMKGNKNQDEFSDFRNLNDMKNIFGKSESGKKGQKIHKKFHKGR